MFGNAKTQADLLKKQEDYIKTLRLKTKLQNDALVAMEERGQNEKLGITPVKDQRSIAEREKDITLQRNKALEHLSSVTDPDVALQVLNQFNDADVLLLNQNWNDILSELKGRKNFGDTFFRNFFTRYVQKQLTTATDTSTEESKRDTITGISIPLTEPQLQGAFNRIQNAFGRLNANQTRTLQNWFTGKSAQERNVIINALSGTTSQERRTKVRAGEQPPSLKTVQEDLDNVYRAIRRNLGRKADADPSIRQTLAELKDAIDAGGAGGGPVDLTPILDKLDDVTRFVEVIKEGHVPKIDEVPLEARDYYKQFTKKDLAYALRSLGGNNRANPYVDYPSSIGSGPTFQTSIDKKDLITLCYRVQERVGHPLDVASMVKNPAYMMSPPTKGVSKPLPASQGTGLVRAYRNRRIIGHGIRSEPTEKYAHFGKYLIHLPSLKKGLLNIKYPSTASIPELRPYNMSSTLQNLLYNMLENERLEIATYNKLNKDEKKYFDKVATMAGLDEQLGIKQTVDDNDREDLKRFELVRGEIISGNDAPQLVDELKRFTIKFMNEGKIRKSDGNQLLYEISCLK